MSSLLGLLTQQMGGDAVPELSRQLGTDEGATGKAVSGALPMLFGALARNTGSSGGTEALASALDRDHDGGILGNVAGFFGRGDTSPGQSILKHVVGDKLGGMQQGLAKMSGLDSGSAGKVLAMLAPMVMGMLGKEKRRQGLGASSLATLLQGESRQAQGTAPEAMGMLGQLLDSDGDGSVMDDVGRIGGGLMGKLFGGDR